MKIRKQNNKKRVICMVFNSGQLIRSIFQSVIYVLTTKKKHKKTIRFLVDTAI